MDFVELDPEIALKLIEGHEDVLSGASRKEEALYRQFVCPRCGREGLQPEIVSIKFAFADPDTPVPRSGLRCRSCDCLFDPHNGLLLELGNPAQIPSEIPIISPRGT